MTVSIKTAAPKEKKTEVAAKPSLTVVSKVIKGDTYLVMADSAKELEDEFAKLYESPGAGQQPALAPPYNPRQLKHIVIHNNILNQCVQAMEVNIDGTGHEFVAAEQKDDGSEGKMDEKEKKEAENFFDEPYPGRSFVSMRRDLRRDMESIGYGFLECLGNVGNELLAMRYVEAQTIRMVRLGQEIERKYKVMRGGKEVELIVKERPRVYMQTFNGKSAQYFKSFGYEQKLNKKTGVFEDPSDPQTVVPLGEQASSLLMFGVDKDYSGPYFLPRWINQLPSVLGSRKAEEQNLEFFDSGGMPPAIIFLQGGSATKDSAEQLRTYLGNGNRKKGRAVVVEMVSNSGTLESGGSVQAKVERFGAERGGDSMYKEYDKAAEEHVRVGFRLPPLFLGRSEDFSFATAVVAYQVAEAQVFQPERTEFDEVINKTIMKAFGWKTIKFKSKPINIKSVEEALAALELAKDRVKGEDFVDAINKLIGENLEYEKPDPMEMMAGAGAGGAKAPAAKPAAGKPALKVVKAQMPDSTLGLIKLVRKYAEAEGLIEPLFDLTDTEIEVVREQVESLPSGKREVFNQLLMDFARPDEPLHAHDH